MFRRFSWHYYTIARNMSTEHERTKTIIPMDLVRLIHLVLGKILLCHPPSSLSPSLHRFHKPGLGPCSSPFTVRPHTKGRASFEFVSLILADIADAYSCDRHSPDPYARIDRAYLGISLSLPARLHQCPSRESPSISTCHLDLDRPPSVIAT